MAKRELSVFSMSFLDLLSGALGAVLILFIIVPKLTSDIERQLEELEQIKELKVDAAKIENMMSELKKSVPDKIYKEMNSRVKKLNETVEELAIEVKSLQNKLAKCEDKRAKVIEQKKELERRVKELEEEINNNGSLVKQLKEEIETQKKSYEKKIKELEEKVKQEELAKAELQKQIEAKTTEVTKLEVKTTDLQTEVSKVMAELQKAQEENKRQSEQIAQYKDRMGLVVDNKNVVFVVDMSNSMDKEPEPQKIYEVKAGLKMMIATMDDSYNIDIVTYPKSRDERYRYKYGKLVPVTNKVKYDIYNHLTTLRALGCTPTKEVMEYVLDSPNYANAGTIILMSDGLPTRRIGGGGKCEDISATGEIESFIKSKNAGKRTINCIGVGKDFRTESSGDAKVKFLKNVAKQNGGFYIGF